MFGNASSSGGYLPSNNLLENVVPEILTVIRLLPRPIKTLSVSSATSFPISFIAFFGTIPSTVFSTASFNIIFSIAILLPQVALA